MYELDPDWINQDISEPLQYVKKEDMEEFHRFENLHLLTPPVEQMFAMKILSSRPKPFRDFSDAELFSWIYSGELKLEVPYTPGVETNGRESDGCFQHQESLLSAMYFLNRER
ncbi:hypothetical protein [Lentibacillus sediminis]|uniref:hypothetical protein n=1 Tax=Lentibacillus sediminis TaxID=1940529 RepID=UPI000C1BB275|nr:hypothetical protein [Lentibacillus sediminis]